MGAGGGCVPFRAECESDGINGDLIGIWSGNFEVVFSCIYFNDDDLSQGEAKQLLGRAKCPLNPCPS